jgi:hypothetical protein
MWRRWGIPQTVSWMWFRSLFCRTRYTAARSLAALGEWVVVAVCTVGIVLGFVGGCVCVLCLLRTVYTRVWCRGVLC